MPAEIKYYDKDMMENPLSLKRTHAPVTANICVFKLTNLLIVMLKKLKLRLKSMKIKSSRKHIFPLDNSSPSARIYPLDV